MSFFKKLFGGGAAAPAEAAKPEVYQGFSIYPEPVAEDRQFRLGARIEKDIDGETKVHHLIRADTFSAREQAAAAAVQKAKVVIDQMGDRLFG